MRTIASGARTQLASGNATLELLVEMLFSPTPLRLTSAARAIEWNGFTWLAGGSLGQVQPVRDSAGEPSALQFALTHVPTEYLSLALGTSVRNVACNLYLGILNSSTHAIEDVALEASFVLDQTSIAESGDAGAVGVTAVPLHTVFQRSKPLRYTDNDQQRLYPGDKSLQYVVSQSTHKDVWPAASFFRK